MEKIKNEELEFIDKNGYLMLRGLLSEQEIKQIKVRVEEIRDEEGVRSGEYGYSELRESLYSTNQTFKLRLFDYSFYLLRFILIGVIRLVPQVRQMTSLYTRLPMDYKYVSSFQRELRQMLVCIVEQMDDRKDRRICDLVNKGEEFDIFYQHPKILALVNHIIGEDFKLSSLNLRSPFGKREHQNMHVDYPWAIKGDRFYACNALWLLDDMSEDNGATRIVPGTHESGKMPHEKMENIKDDHPDQIKISGRAGDVLFVNSHVWHGGTRNQSGKERTIIQSYFVHRAHTPQQHQRFQLRDKTRERLNDDVLHLLDIP